MKKLLLYVVLTFLGTGFSYSQVYFQDYLIANSVQDPYITFAADLDGDSDMDLIYATNLTGNDGIYWYENINGQGDFEPRQSIVSNTGSFTSIYAADLDGDGDMDILSSSWRDNRIAWYENLDGFGAFGKPKIISDTAINASSVYAGDIDGDGDLDVVSASDNRITLYENTNGMGDFVEKQVKNYQEPYSVVLFDMDNDNDLDIVFATNSYAYIDKIAWIENADGLGNFTIEHTVVSNTNNIRSIDVTDINQDGHPDIVSASPYGDKIAWYENLDGNFGVEQVITTEFRDPRSVVAADIDGDGDMDVFANSYDDSYSLDSQNEYRIVWYENLDGNGNFSSPNIISNSRPKTDSLFACDIDGDNDIDFFSVGRGAYSNLYWYENTDGNGTYDVNHIINKSWDATSSSIADIDGDGDNDVVSSSRILNLEDKIAWFENKDGLGDFGLEQVVATQEIINSSNIAAKINTSDIDGDGDIDIIFGRHSNKIAWLENIDGRGSFGSEQVISEDIEGLSSLYTVDMDADDDMDILCTSTYSGKVVWYENIDGSGTFSTENLINDSGSTSSVYAGDIDNDGDIDVVVASELNDKIVWHENDGNQNFGAEKIITETIDRAYTVRTDDLDGDGDLDILSGSITGTIIAWYENLDGLGNFGPEKIIINTSSDSYVSVLSSDLDNDGDIDVVYTIADDPYGDSRVAWSENMDGQGNFGEEQVIEYGDFVFLQSIDDIDGDGKMDLLSSELGWYKNLGMSSPESLNINVRLNDITCYGNNDASLEIEASGGMMPYFFELLDENNTTVIPIQSSNLFNGLLPGNYVAKVQDSNGDVVYGNTVTIVEPSELIAETTTTGIVCKGSNDGVIKVNASGGTPPYQYEINGNGYVDSNLFEGLQPENYSINVSDSNGCITVVNTVITEPSTEFTILGITITEATCNGNQDGSLEINVTGGVPPYQFQINNGTLINSGIFENLNPGQYTVKAYDSLGCELTSSITMETSTSLSFKNIIVEPASCINSNDAQISIMVSDGTLPYEYSLDGLSYTENDNFTNLGVGVYTVFVRDASGCEIVEQITIESESGPDFDGDGIADVCDDDIDGDGVTNSDDQCNNTSLLSTVDSNGCEVFTLPTANFSVRTVGESCIESNNGSITVSAVENLGYTASLSQGGAFIESITFTDSTSFYNLESGTYELCITIEEHPKYVQCFSLQITEPELLSVQSNVNVTGKEITLKFQGGTKYTIDLNGSVYSTEDSEITLPLNAMNNTLSVRTDFKCQGTYEESILLGQDVTIFPNPAPNGRITIIFNTVFEGDTQLSMYTVNGILMLDESRFFDSKEVTLDVGNIAQGVYILKISRGINIQTQKVIIK